MEETVASSTVLSSPESKNLDEPLDLTLFYAVTACSLFSVLIPRIVALAVYLLVWDSPVERSLFRQISDLKKELRSLSITDEFAKYSKTQRKLNKAQDDLDSKNRDRVIHVTKVKILMYIILYSITTPIGIYLNWNYSHHPVLVLPQNTLFPLDWILGFPTGKNDAISVFSWSIIAGYIFRSVMK